MPSRAVLLAALLLPSLAAAQANPISAANPESIRAAILAYGHKARLETGSDGNPVIRGRMDNINYDVFFLNCDGGQNCLDLQFSTGFDVETALTPEWANQWNMDWAMGRVAVDEQGDPYMTYAVSGVGGMSEEYFRGIMEAWEAIVTDFLDDIDW